VSFASMLAKERAILHRRRFDKPDDEEN